MKQFLLALVVMLLPAAALAQTKQPHTYTRDQIKQVRAADRSNADPMPPSAQRKR